jgi:acetyl-CoA carboxylase biotin carboxyl carrier protein
MSDLPLTPEDVAEIVAILDGSGYAKLDVKTARFRLRVAREGEGWTQEWEFGEAAEAAPVREAEAAAPVADDGDGTAVRSPLPGTFYRAPQPGAPPFVGAGDSVGPDTVVGIVETMKLMNPVHAGTSGKVSAILIDNGTLVPAGTVLMRIE